MLRSRDRGRVRSGRVSIDLELEESGGVEVLSPAGDRGNYIWTRKQAQVPVRGSVQIGDRRHSVDGQAFIDDSAGYHDRHTSWRWSAGNGSTTDGHEVAWNLVDGLHDGAQASERTLWVDGEPQPLGAVSFPAGLSCVCFDDGASLSFSEWSSGGGDQPAAAEVGLPPAVRRLQRDAARRPRAGPGLRRDQQHDVHW